MEMLAMVSDGQPCLCVPNVFIFLLSASDACWPVPSTAWFLVASETPRGAARGCDADADKDGAE